MVEADAGFVCGADDIDELEALGVGGYCLCDGIFVGGDDPFGGLRGVLERGVPLVVIRLIDGAFEGNAGALEGSDVVGGPDEDGALRGQMVEGAGVGGFKGDAGAGILNGLGEDETGFCE